MEETSGEHLGAFWEASGSHLGVIWETFGGLEAEEASGRHLEVRSHKTCLPLERNANLPLKFQFCEGDLKVPLIMYAFLQQHLRAHRRPHRFPHHCRNHGPFTNTVRTPLAEAS